MAAARMFSALMWYRRFVSSALLLLAASAAEAQRAAVAGVVVSRETGERLAFAILELAGTGREQFADDSGRFFFGDLPSATLELRVRRLGYRPTTISVVPRAGVTDSVTVALDRLAVTLEQVTVRSWPPCHHPGAPDPARDTALAAVFSQLRLNAEQFRLLRRSYPYEYKVSRTMTQRARETGKLLLYGHLVQTIRSDAGARYSPGAVIRRRGRATAFVIPTLVDFADDRFIASHCFHYAGLDRVDSVAMVRVDLVAAESLEGPDVNGSMYLDPQTFQIRRAILHLSKRDRRMTHVADLRVTTDFGEILPFIPIVVEVSSVQVIDPTAKSDFDEAYEMQSLLEFRFRGRRPGG